MRTLYLLMVMGLLAATLPSALMGSHPQAQTKPVYKVRDYGLKCDGSSDDTAAFISLISKVSSEGGGDIQLPAGTCIVTSLNLASNVSIRGQGRGVTTIKVKDHAGDYGAVFGTIYKTFTNVRFADLTIDQNTTNNATTSNIHTSGRLVIATGAGSNKLSIDRVEFKDLANINTVYSGSEFTNIMDSIFTLNCGSSVYYDHSTLYVAGEHSATRHNTFKGCVNGAGSVTAIEIHGGSQTVTGNVIDRYWLGMNITGVATTDSNDLSVIANTITNACYGIQLWSQQYRAHTSGYGLHGVTIRIESYSFDPNCLD